MKAHRWMRLAALAALVVIGTWAITTSRMLADISALTSRLDPWVWLLHLLSLVAFLGVALVALWHARVVWTGKRRWPAKAWSLVLAASGVMLLYVAVVFRLIAFDVHY
jgi:hypothetical protein